LQYKESTLTNNNVLSSEMKIAYVYDVIYPYVIGGVQKRVWEIAKRLTKKNEVHIYGMKHWDGEAIRVRNGVYLHGVCEPKEVYVDGRRSIGEAIYFASKVLLPLLKENFDIIECQNMPYFPCFSASFSGFIKKTPLVITWYEVWDDYWNDYLGNKIFAFMAKSIERWTSKLPAHTISTSKTTTDKLTRILGVSHTKISTIPLGIDFEEIGGQHGCEGFDILFVGRLIKDKNVAVLIDAVDLVRRIFPTVTCGIIGDGPEKKSLRKISANLSKNVFFLGSRCHRETISYMKSSKIFVFPSTREGFGLAPLEAMASGLPVIGIEHANNASKDYIIHGLNGYKAKNLSAKVIGRYMMKLLSDIELRNELSRNALEFSKSFGWENIVDSTIKVYEAVLNTNR